MTKFGNFMLIGLLLVAGCRPDPAVNTLHSQQFRRQLWDDLKVGTPVTNLLAEMGHPLAVWECEKFGNQYFLESGSYVKTFTYSPDAAHQSGRFLKFYYSAPDKGDAEWYEYVVCIENNIVVYKYVRLFPKD